MSENQIFVLLIDGDNVQLSYMPYLLEEIFKYRKPIINRIYLNKSSIEKVSQWDSLITEYSLDPQYVPNNTTSKNAVDIALAVDMMELLYTRPEITHFLLVSSDSDFTYLAKYIVAQGKVIIGFGESKTPKSFMKSCTNFVNVQRYLPEVEQSSDLNLTQDDELTCDDLVSLEHLLLQVYEDAHRDANGWSHVSNLRKKMLEKVPEFQGSYYSNIQHLANTISVLVTCYPRGIIQIEEKNNPKNPNYIVRIDCDALRFVRVYKMILENQLSENGWVTLSNIGTELSKHPAYPNGFKYQEMSKLSSIVSVMSNKYSEIKMNSKHPYAVRIKL